MQEFKASESDAGARADVFVASKYPQFSRSSLQLLFDRGLVQVDGEPAKAAHKVEAGDKVRVDGTLLSAAPPQIELPVIYEDADVTVINKPAGVLTHSKGALNLEGTVASFIKPQVKGLEGNRAGIVHRLDRATSGVIIVAKDADALSKLQKQFSTRKTKKTYIAVVEGIPKPKKAVIDIPIMRNPAKPQTFKTGEQGKPAITEYQTLKIFKKNGRVYSLLELKPQTGRTHQLRVHMGYIGHPIVGDTVYGHTGPNLLLHAKSLEITLPSNERKTFEAPLPDYIKEFASV